VNSIYTSIRRTGNQARLGTYHSGQDHTSFNPGLDALENYRYLMQCGYLP